MIRLTFLYEKVDAFMYQIVFHLAVMRKGDFSSANDQPARDITATASPDRLNQIRSHWNER